ncbi:MAG TPA: PKD domain-containing protein [Longimicrobiaceae bacterium]|nr:PKD domain-containing protein [Longimicrobiaceae bacterium]
MKLRIRSLAIFALALIAGSCGDQPTEPSPGPDPDPTPPPAAAPTASFTTAGSTQAGEPTTFDASASTDPESSALVYSWDFGDGVRGGAETVAHLYTEAGSYNVSLVVANTGGSADTVSSTLTISAPPAPTGTATLSGQITDAAGDPLEGVTVALVGGSLSATTDADGALTFSNFPAGAPATLNLSKDGYAATFARVEIADGSAEGYFMAALQARDAATTLSNVADGGTIAGQDGVTITIAADALVDQDGNPVTGDIRGALTPLDVSGDAMRAFPGSTTALSATGETSILLPFGAAEFELTQGGESLQIAPGKTATIEIPIYTAGVAAGDAVALWSLDEASAIWTQEGMGEVVASSDSPTGLALSATITHLSSWSAGDEDEFSTVPGWQAMEALKVVMRQRGLTPSPESGLTLDDYVHTNVTDGSDGGIRNVNLWLDTDGNIVPDPEWQEFHPTYCKQRARFMEGAVRLLNFKVIRIGPGEYSVFAQDMAVDTRIIDEQREGISSGVLDALASAWAQMGTSVGAPTDPCGEVRLVHVGGSDAGDTFVFQAGFQGSYGDNLTYTWNFGDGSAAAEGTPRMEHVYDRAGTYQVSVLVEGEGLEPGTATVSLVIGGDLELSFDSTIEVVASDHTMMTHVAGTVALALNEDGTAYIGSGTIVNLVDTYTAGEDNCTKQLLDGTLRVRALTFPGMPGAGDEVELQFDFPEYPRIMLTCPTEGGDFSIGISIFGMHFWFLRVVEEEIVAPPEGGFENAEDMDYLIRGWDTNVEDPLVARKIYDWSYSMDAEMTVNEKTTIEIRRVEP